MRMDAGATPALNTYTHKIVHENVQMFFFLDNCELSFLWRVIIQQKKMNIFYIVFRAGFAPAAMRIIHIVFNRNSFELSNKL